MELGGPLRLEPRDCPAVWYGGEAWVGGRSVQPFEDWRGGLNTLRVSDCVYIGPAAGGGPRVAVLDARTGERVAPDYWAGDPADRSGVVFVPAPAGPPEPAGGLVPVVPAITAGDVTHPDPFVVFVDWERPPSSDWVTLGMARLAADLPVPGLVFATVRPELYPGFYGTAVALPDLRYAEDAAGGQKFAGLAWADWTDGPPSNVVGEAVYAGYEYSTAAGFGSLLGHEIAHGFGWQHGDDGDFRNDLGAIARGVELARGFNGN